MARASSAVVSAIAKYGPKVVRHAPGALTFVTTYLREHPAVPAWTRDRLTDVAERLRRLRSGDAEQVRGKLAIVRDEVAAMEDLPADVSAEWLRRAANVEHATNLATRLSGPEQRRTLASLRGQADALLAEVIAAIAGGPASPEVPAE